MNQDIANLKWIIKLETFLYQIVKEWCTSVHHEMRDAVRGCALGGPRELSKYG